MRQMGMPLATIRHVLAAADDVPADAETLVHNYIQGLKAQLERAQNLAEKLCK